LESDSGSKNTLQKLKTFDQKNWISENLSCKKIQEAG